MSNGADEVAAQTAPPPDLMRELPPAFDGDAMQAAPQAWADVARWRKVERTRLIEARLAIPADTRAAMSGKIGEIGRASCRERVL